MKGKPKRLMESIWKKTTKIEDKPALATNLETDVLIIGAGMAGILTGYLLTEAGREVTIIDAGDLGDGQTGNTTAKITSQHNLIYDRLIKNFGVDKATQYAMANQNAIEEYERIIHKEQIDCDFKRCQAYLYSERESECLKQEERAAREAGIEAEFTTETELPFLVEGALCFPNQASFHPLKFLQALSKKLTIFCHTKALEINDYKVKTTNGTITAEKIVFACHFPFLNVPGYYFLRMHQERSYVVSYENVPAFENMYLGIDQDGLSFRSYDKYLLLGGGGHHTGKKEPSMGYEPIRKKAGELFNGAKEVTAWSAQDCMTLDGIPYIGRFSSSMEHVYVATGFGKWGMSSSMVAACIIRDEIIGRENPYKEVFSPQRFHLSASAKTLFKESMCTVKGFTKKFGELPEKELKKLESGKGIKIEYEKEKVGAYKDETGNVYLVSAICPHLGCELEWNPEEKSWDCPCHGSRFDYKGKLLDGPAQKNIVVS